MMKRHSSLLGGVKEVLENDDLMKQVCEQNKKEILVIFEDRKVKWRLQELIAEASYCKKSSISVPQDLHALLEGAVNESGQANLENLKCKEQSISLQEEEMNLLKKRRIQKMLTFVNLESEDSKPSPSIEEYEAALSVNAKGYTIHYKRDVDEIMVNTYNPEWICAWNGNMDFQLCLDYFAVITYISDYYCKDDSGTMKMLQEALKESMHEDLRCQLRRLVSVFLTHRQMGESEAYYRIFPSMHMKESNVKTVFAQTGFNPSRYLERIEDKDVNQCEKVVEVEGRLGK